MSYCQCIGNHPNDKYYPTKEKLIHLNYPNIIKIPEGKKDLKTIMDHLVKIEVVHIAKMIII